ncbi:hypothetical protein BH09PAT2_BH09PAT2_05200 [soil metagenome]
MKLSTILKDQSGQTLVTLLVFIVVATAVTSTAVAVLINTTRSSSIIAQSITASHIADSGAENALLRLLRDPNYIGETLTVGSGIATITVTGTTAKTITSIGKIGNFQKTVQVVVTYNNNMTVSSWTYTY